MILISKRFKQWILTLCLLVVAGFGVLAQEETEDDKPAEKVDILILYDRPMNGHGYQLDHVLDVPWNYRNGTDQYISIHGSFENYSNTVSTTFARNLLFSNGISNELKQKVLDNGGENNRFEGNFQLGVTYADYGQLPLIGSGYWYVGAEYYNGLGFAFNDETFQLAFYGNAGFENDTVNIPYLYGNYRSYTKLQLGFNKAWNNSSSSWYAGLGISFIQSPIDISIDVEDSYLYTAEAGEYLDIKYDALVQQSNKDSIGFFEFNGVGFATDLYLAGIKYGWGSLSLLVEDLGFIRYSQQTSIYEGDSTIRFEGLVVDNILDFDDSFQGNYNPDSLFSILNISESSGSYTRMLPATITLRYGMQLGPADLSIGVKYKTLPKYLPFVYAKGSYYFKRFENQFYASASLGFGGYSNYNFGLEVHKQFGRFGFTLGSTNVLGLVAPDAFTNSSAYLRLSSIF